MVNWLRLLVLSVDSLIVEPTVSMLSVEQELHKRGSAALTYLSHQAVTDLHMVFSHDAEPARTVQAVNIAIQASNIVQRANAEVKWQAVRLRDWVLILEYGSAVSTAVKQGYWAALMATSVMTLFGSRCRPQHVDILHDLDNSEVLALEFLHSQSLGRTYLDHVGVSALNIKTPNIKSPNIKTPGVSPKTLCDYVLMRSEPCKQMLRHLYTLNLIKGVSDGSSMSMRQLYLTETGFELMSRLHFGTVTRT